MANLSLSYDAQDDSNPIARELRIDKTGKGTVTFRGVARICGVAPTSLYRSKPIRGGVKSSQKTSESSSHQGFAGGVMFPAKLTQKLVGAGFDLSTFHEWKKNGIPDLAVAVIVEHYAFDAGERCTKEASLAFRSFAAIGIRSWIQKELGWQPPSEVDQFIDNHILREARSWEVVFDRQWIKAAEQATGWGWGDPCMRHLINLLVYDRLPVEVRQELDRLNPVGLDGHRAKKQHQFFSVESVEQVLKLQISVSRSLLLVSTSWGELKENSRRHFEGMSQLKLLP